MTFLVGALLGLMVGACGGVLLMGALVAGKQADARPERARDVGAL